jgi:hypothetical protein
MLQGIIKQCEELDADLRSMWISPAEVQLSSEVIAAGATSTVYRGTLRGDPVAVKRCRQARPLSPASSGEAPSSKAPLMTGTLARELCIIARASRECGRMCRWAGCHDTAGCWYDGCVLTCCGGAAHMLPSSVLNLQGWLPQINPHHCMCVQSVHPPTCSTNPTGTWASPCWSSSQPW